MKITMDDLESDMTTSQNDSIDEDFPDENDCFTLSRHALQRSQDSGAVTDWSRGSLSPTRQSCQSRDSFQSDGCRDDKFVTVLSINGGFHPPVTICNDQQVVPVKAEFVTVLAIGDTAQSGVSTAGVCLNIRDDGPSENTKCSFIEEVATISRRPGEKLGFGLKFDGGYDKHDPVKRLFIQCCARDSPASQIQCSWGKIVEADEIIAISEMPVSSLTRTQIIQKLTEESQSNLVLKLRHYWHENQRENILQHLLKGTHVSGKTTTEITVQNVSHSQERAVDVPIEFLNSRQETKVPNDKWENATNDKQMAPPVPPPRKKKGRHHSISIHSLTKTILSRSLSSSEVLGQGTRINSSTPNKPPRTKLQQSRSLGMDQVVADVGSQLVAKEKTQPVIPVTISVTDNEVNRFESSPPLKVAQVEEIPVIEKCSSPQPAVAQVYTNLIAEEDKRLSSLLDLESESDTNSSVSTVVDCWSLPPSNTPSSPSSLCTEQNNPFIQENTDHLDSLESIDIHLEGTDLLRGLLKENSSFMNQFFSQRDPDGEHDSGVGIMVETEPSSLVDEIFALIRPPEIFLDHNSQQSDDEENDHFVLDDITMTEYRNSFSQPPVDDTLDSTFIPTTDIGQSDSTHSHDSESEDALREFLEVEQTTAMCTGEPLPIPTSDTVAISESEPSHGEPPAEEEPNYVEKENSLPLEISTISDGHDFAKTCSDSAKIVPPKPKPRLLLQQTAVESKRKILHEQKDKVDTKENQHKNKLNTRNKMTSKIPQAATTGAAASTSAGSRANSAVVAAGPRMISAVSKSTRNVSSNKTAAPSACSANKNAVIKKTSSSSGIGHKIVASSSPNSNLSSSPSGLKAVNSSLKSEGEKYKRMAVKSSPMETSASKIPRAYPKKCQSHIDLARPVALTGPNSMSLGKKFSHGPELTVSKSGGKTAKRKWVTSGNVANQVAMETTFSTPPAISRLPPDGHEFPNHYEETTGDQQFKSRIRSGLSWRGNRDERSERSVKDKIALFTNDDKNPVKASTNAVNKKPKSDHYPQMESTTETKQVAKTLSYSVDNLTSSTLKSTSRLPISIRSEIRSSSRNKDMKSNIESVNLSERSRSLLDVTHSTANKRHSLNHMPTPTQRKTSLTNLAESRRKSLSKLRGLVIPDVDPKPETAPSKPIIDLPEIISKDSILVQGKVNFPLSRNDPLRGSQSSVTSSSSGTDVVDSRKPSLTPLTWKNTSPTMLKYSPAFKRKELSVIRPYSTDSVYIDKTTTTNQASDKEEISSVTYLPPIPSSKPPSLPKETLETTLIDSDLCHSLVAKNQEEVSDTDGDSAVSSSRSSFSPSESPVPVADHRDENKATNEESTAAAASRVLKAHSVEALNRKNVLQSARYSSGGHVDELFNPAESRPVKLSIDIDSPNKTMDSPTSPLNPSPLRSRKAADFEQALKIFSESEKNEKASPKSRQERKLSDKEIKVAFINEVLDEPPAPDTASLLLSEKIEQVVPVKVQETTVSPTTSLRKVANEGRWNGIESKYSTKSAVNAREQKNFRALAERWEAIASDAPTIGQPPSPPTTKPTPPQIAKKQEFSKVNRDEGFLQIKRNSKSRAADEIIEQHVENGLEKSTSTSSTLSFSSVSTSTNHSLKNSNNSSSKGLAGVVEIRKAFERVREELETESISNIERKHAVDDYIPEQLMMKPHGIFSLPNYSSALNNATSCPTNYHVRMSSLDSNTSEDGSFSFGGFGPFGIGVKDNYGSITSLASSTSLISPQELQQLLDDANQSLEESGTPSHEIVVVVLHRGDVSGPASLGLGITLAGGADYETKEITVHKVIAGSVADRDGRIQKGDRVISINGKSLKGVTHREALSILKAPRPEVVLVLSRNRSVSPQEGTHDDKDLQITFTSCPQFINTRINSSGHLISSRPPRILESPSDLGMYDTEDVNRGPPLKTTLIKDGAGLGFSLEGGKDSPLGDRPLTVKKIFTGGAASKNGVLQVGDQIISVNGCDVTGMSRIEAWNLMKKLPDGNVTLIIRQSLDSTSTGT